MQVFRRGGYRELSAVVAELEPERTVARRTPDRESTKPAPAVSSLGLAVTDLTDTQKRELKIKSGVRVEAVEGLAARAGMREGDVVVALDNVEITSARQFEAAVAKLDKNKPASILARRGDVANYFVLRLARTP